MIFYTALRTIYWRIRKIRGDGMIGFPCDMPVHYQLAINLPILSKKYLQLSHYSGKSS